jgi:hypothetical protein
MTALALGFWIFQQICCRYTTLYRKKVDLDQGVRTGHYRLCRKYYRSLPVILGTVPVHTEVVTTGFYGDDTLDFYGRSRLTGRYR